MHAVRVAPAWGQPVVDSFTAKPGHARAKKHSSNRNCGSHAWFVWPADTTSRVMPIHGSRHNPVSIVNKTKVTVRSLRDKKARNVYGFYLGPGANLRLTHLQRNLYTHAQKNTRPTGAMAHMHGSGFLQKLYQPEHARE